ncbi:MAG: TonB-dependent receptor [Rhodothermales bacterium]
MKQSRSWWILLVWLCALPVAASAQQAQGSLMGEVSSADDGAPLPGVDVILPMLGQGAVTDAEGRFEIDGLAPGLYAVVFSYVGFERIERTVDLTSSLTPLRIQMEPAVLEADEVTITADQADVRLTAATQSVETLQARELDEARGQTLGATLDRLPGVTTLNTGPSISKPVVRGLHSERVLVLNDGVPQEGQQWGGEHAPEIDPFAAARIQVIKGAAGVEYGAGAIGGVIRVEPRDLPEAPGVGALVSSNAFSNSTQGAGSVLVEGALGSVPGLGWRVQGTFRKAGDARTPGYVLGNTAFEERNVSAALGYHRGGSGLEAYYSRFSTDLGIFRGAHVSTLAGLQQALEQERPAVDYAFSYDIGAPKQDVTHDLITLKGHHALPSGDQVEVQYGFQRNHRLEYDAHRLAGRDPLARPAFDLTLLTHTLETKLRLRPRGRFFGVAGLSGMNQGNTNASAGYLIPNFRAITGGAFARGTWVAGNVTLEAGTRLDHRWMEAFPREAGDRGDFVRETHGYTSLSGVAGVIWRFAPAWSLASNLGTAWRPPSVNELYSYGVHHGTAQFETGNSEMGAERTVSLDATLRHVGRRAELEVSAYANRMAGYIYLYPSQEPTVTIRGVFPTFAFRQTDAFLRGLDGLAAYRLGRLRLEVSGSLVRGTDQEADVPLLYMPADRVGLSGEFTLPDVGALHGSRLRLGSTFVREQTEVPPGQVDYGRVPEGYALLSVGYNADLYIGGMDVQLGLSVENLLDTAYRDYLSRYRYFADDPGRNVVFRVQIPLGAFEAE